jgi:triosephosphate isomerase
MTQRRKLIAGNWKMNGLKDEGLALARTLSQHAASEKEALAGDLLLCPPATLLVAVASLLSGSAVLLGAQDCHAAAKGAHTGDLSAEMLKDAGCSHVILGHSERRSDHAESDAAVRAKAEAARRVGLVAIICVGESEAEREAGRALAVVQKQLAGSIPEGMGSSGLVIAYEPVWAIGTGKTASPADVAEMHAHIRKRLAENVAEADHVRILYGGSVKPGNARELLAVADVDGALVGGASLVADDFWAIARSCA